MALAAADFRGIFPEFAQPQDYPDATISFWLTFAYGLLPAASWGAQLDMGAGLVVAHHLVIAKRNLATAESGGIPGTVTGPVSSKAIDKVSASHDTKAVTWDGEAFWNQSTYGIQYWQIARLIGMGGIQLGTPGTDALTGVGGWLTQ
ncbi:MAG: DUF4054 domain-containing protein [Rhodospirillales bacterium]|nr:DUF4054 domain-containing protein [Rhodospirillales bacterium]